MHSSGMRTVATCSVAAVCWHVSSDWAALVGKAVSVNGFQQLRCYEIVCYAEFECACGSFSEYADHF
jgi:hypothetical protein